MKKIYVYYVPKLNRIIELREPSAFVVNDSDYNFYDVILLGEL